MKLSEHLAQDHESGDFGNALLGYSERAALLENTLETVCFHLRRNDHLEAPTGFRCTNELIANIENTLRKTNLRIKGCGGQLVYDDDEWKCGIPRHGSKLAYCKVCDPSEGIRHINPSAPTIDA